jgi:hypothetical protein
MSKGKALIYGLHRDIRAYDTSEALNAMPWVRSVTVVSVAIVVALAMMVRVSICSEKTPARFTTRLIPTGRMDVLRGRVIRVT